VLKRETFLHAIQAIQQQEKLTERLNEIYREMTDGIGFLVMDSFTTWALVKTLEDGMEDQAEYVSWWLYESSENRKTVSWEEEGKIISVDLSDMNALYDFLVQCAEERKGQKNDSSDGVE